MITIGARAHDFDHHDPESLFSAVSDAGYRAVQLACPKSFSWSYPLNEEQAERIVNASQKYHVEVAVLGCYIDAAARDKEARLNAVNTFIAGLKTGRDLNVRCVGTETTHFSGPESERAAAFDRLTDSVLRMAEAAEKYSVYMGVEPVFSNTLATPELALELKHRVDSEKLKWIWDAINLLDPSSPEENAPYQEHTARLLGKDILAMHIKGVKYKQTKVKTACPLEEGEFDWRFPFLWAKQQENMVLLREEAIPARSAAEIRLMNSWLSE